MKKLLFAALLLMGLTACNGGSSVATDTTVDSVEVLTDSVSTDSLIEVVDSLAVDTIA